MIEAVNKILKYQYLFRKPIADQKHLQEAIRSAIDDYNNRPHYALKGITPADAYEGKVFNRDEYHGRIEAAREKELRKIVGLAILACRLQSRSMQNDIHATISPCEQ